MFFLGATDNSAPRPKSQVALRNSVEVYISLCNRLHDIALSSAGIPNLLKCVGADLVHSAAFQSDTKSKLKREE